MAWFDLIVSWAVLLILGSCRDRWTATLQWNAIHADLPRTKRLIHGAPDKAREGGGKREREREREKESASPVEALGVNCRQAERRAMHRFNVLMGLVSSIFHRGVRCATNCCHHDCGLTGRGHLQKPRIGLHRSAAVRTEEGTHVYIDLLVAYRYPLERLLWLLVVPFRAVRLRFRPLSCNAIAAARAWLLWLAAEKSREAGLGGVHLRSRGRLLLLQQPCRRGARSGGGCRPARRTSGPRKDRQPWEGNGWNR